MNTNLNFKYGLYEGLQSALYNEGTIYVTTDEKAMYVDLGGSRIRLGQTVSLTVEDWKNLEPPFSEDAFYYITNANALVKWTGDSWTQINSTADVKDVLGLKGIVDSLPLNANKGDVYIVQTEQGSELKVCNGYEGQTLKWTDLPTYGNAYIEINDLKSSVTAGFSDLQSQINSITGVEGGDFGSLNQINENLTNVKEYLNFVGEVDSLPTSNVAIGAIYGLLNEDQPITYYVCTGNKADGSIDWKTIDTLGKTIIDFNNSLSGISANIQTLDGKIGTINGSVADNLSSINDELTNVNTNIQNNLDLIKTLTGFIGTVEALPEAGVNPGDICIYNNEVYKYKDENTKWEKITNLGKSIVEIENDISGLNGNIQTINNELNTINGNIDELELALGKAFTYTKLTSKPETCDGYNEYDIIVVENNAFIAKKDTQGKLQWVNNTTAIKDLNEKFDSASVNVNKELSDIKTGIQGINGQIEGLVALEKATDALVYKGTISQQIDADDEPYVQGLPSENVKNGFTYKAVTNIDKTLISNLVSVVNTDNKIRIGDLLVATGTEDSESGIITSNLQWTHIPSGYHADYVPEMTVELFEPTIVDDEGNTTTLPSTAKILLTSAHASTGTTGDLGTVIISPKEDSSIAINVDNTQIKIGMVWGTF